MANKGIMYIDGQRVPFDGEPNVLSVIRKAGIEMPTFCYYSDLSVYGACRMCVVEDERGKIETSCSMKPRDGLSIRTNTARLLKHRRMILELLLASHNCSCTTCEKSGDCRLQELAMRFGVRKVRFGDSREESKLDDSSPAVVRDPSKCILCGDCVRMCGETIGMDKIFYQNSGTEANEAMIKMARKYGIEKYGPNRYHIVTAKMGFHGRTFGAMSATGQPGNGCQVGFGPMTYGFSYAPYNDLQAFKDACTENTIAIMVEPVQGEGGVHPATKEFMQGLRKFCDENDMLLLIDEVQTGWCRTGAVMSYMNYGIKPDIVSMAKGLGGGMPIGAICATAEVAKAFTPGSHGTTFGGHPVSCAAALAEVNELIDRDLAGNAKKVGDYFAEKLAKLPHVKEVRHQGLLVGVEFDDIISGVEVKHGCLDRHLLITAIGAHIIRLIPPLIVTEEDCDKAVAIIEETVKALEK